MASGVEVSWDEAFEAAAAAMLRKAQAGEDVGVLMSPSAAHSSEAYFLARNV